MRKLIGERMKHSLMVNAQLTHTVIVDMAAATALRAQCKAQGTKISFNDIVLAATVRALQDFPMMNSEFTPDGILVKDSINLGMAVALEEGLIVPNIKNAQQLTLAELSTAAADLALRAREGRLRNSEYRKGSFTVSNLGMMGLDSFQAIINEPEVGILAVGRISDTPCVVDGAICIRPKMTLVLSYDHRMMDGAPAGRFLVGIRDYLEAPQQLLTPAAR